CAEDADNQLHRQHFGAVLIFAKALFVDAAKRPNGGHRRAAFDEAAIRPLAADADALGHLDAFAIRESNLAIFGNAGPEQAARAAEVIRGFAASYRTADVVLVLIGGDSLSRSIGQDLD